MKKRTLPVLACLTLCLGLMLAVTITAGAANGASVSVGGVELKVPDEGGPVYAMTDDTTGLVSLGGTADNYNVMWDGETSTLTLNNANIQVHTEDTVSYYDGIHVAGVYDLTLKLVGSSSITVTGDVTGDDYASGISVSSGLSIAGDGSLTITAPDRGIVADSLSVSGGSVSATATGEDGYGIHADILNISGGSVSATATANGQGGYGIYTYDTTISGGSVSATANGQYGYGIFTSYTMTISGGTVSATANGKSGCGIFTGNLDIFQAGSVSANADGENGYGISVGSLSVSGGSITANADGESGLGISAGSLSVSGGSVSATATANGQGGYGIYTSYTMTISGGSLTATANSQYGYGIYAGSLNISQTGSVSATANGQYGYGINADSLNISQTGSVSATATGQGGYGIYTNDTMTISGGSLTATANGQYGCGIRTKSLSVSEAGSVTAISGNSVGIDSNYTEISGGIVRVKAGFYGLQAYQEMTISGGSVAVTAAYECSITSPSITISGGSVTAAASEAGNGISALSLEISGGSVTAAASEAGNGIHAGSMTISGGSVTATGAGEIDPSDPSASCGYGIVIRNSGSISIDPPADRPITLVARTDADSADGEAVQTFSAIGSFDPSSSPYQYIRTYVAGTVEIPVVAVTMNTPTLSLAPGSTEVLVAAVTPTNATNQQVTWTSSKPAIATVSQSGFVTAHEPGMAVITASAGGKTASCTVTVTSRIYQITASPAALNFDPVSEGYPDAPAQQSVTVTNTGNQTVTVYRPSAEHYDVKLYDYYGQIINSIDLVPGSSATLYVAPKDGLAAGSYDAGLTISGSDGAAATVGLSFVVTEPSHTHSYGTVWISDENSHWQACECGAKRNLAGHVYSNDQDADCNICGYVRQITSVVYTISFDGCGGTSPQPQTTVNGGTLTSLPSSSRNGYTFAGWYTSSGERVTLSTVFTGNTTLYARWESSGSGEGSGEDSGEGGGSISAGGGEDSEPSYSVSLSDNSNLEGGAISVKKSYAEEGETFSFTVTPREGYQVEKVTVLDSQGREIDLTYEGGGEYSFRMPAGTVDIQVSFQPLGAQPAPLPFTDVAEGAWYAQAVSYVYENGLMSGTGGGQFSPDATTSRSMIATILWSMAGNPVVNYAMDFADVPQGQWYSEAVRWAASEGIVSGYGDTFGTNDPITREQLAVMLWNCAGRPAPSGTLPAYPDRDKVSSWALEAITWCVEQGILSNLDGALAPQGQATRAQAAVMLMQFCEKVTAR